MIAAVSDVIFSGCSVVIGVFIIEVVDSVTTSSSSS